MSDDGDLFGFALGLGETKPINRNNDSNVESRNYSFSTYGKFDDGSNALQYIFGISKLEFDSDDWMKRASERSARSESGYMDLLLSFVL